MGRRKLREVVSLFLSFIHCAPSLRCFCLFVEPVWKADVYYANDSNLSNLQHKKNDNFLEPLSVCPTNSRGKFHYRLMETMDIL